MSVPWGLFLADSFEISERREGTRWTFLIKCCTSGTLSLPTPFWILQTSALCRALAISLLCLILYKHLKMAVPMPVQIPELQFLCSQVFFICKLWFSPRKLFLAIFLCSIHCTLAHQALVSSRHPLALPETTYINHQFLDCKIETPCLSRIVFY